MDEPMNHEAMQTIAYLANELRKAHETAAQQHQALMAQKKRIEELQAMKSVDPYETAGAPAPTGE
jgi:hypothetical protein